MWSGEEHDAVDFGNYVGVLTIMLTEHICLFYYQASHGVRNKDDRVLTNRHIIFSESIGEDQHPKQEIFGKVNDVEIGSNAFEVGVVPVGKDSIRRQFIFFG